MIFNKIKQYEKLVKKINSFETEVSSLSQNEMIEKTRTFQDEIKKLGLDKKKINKYLDNILPYAFALVKEASYRTLNMKHFDVQLIGGQILHQGCIAEMKTGEGKTLVITLPAYLNALTGQGVHVVTVNDYLAKRDREKMGVVYEYLGLSVGLIQSNQTIISKRENYSKDITYVTNSVVGFDYLRDNLTKNIEHKVLLKGLNYAVIDEVDSILIDEARTPLIISGQGICNSDLYYKANDFVKEVTAVIRTKDETSTLEKALNKNKFNSDYEQDVIIDKKEKTVLLTDNGVSKAENFFDIDNLGDSIHSTIMHHIQQALKAHYLFKKDADYIIKENKIEIIDEFTGRVLIGRKYSDGLHQALEAKENLEITPDNKTLASVTYQNLFRLYYKKCGLTGTGKTEEDEFLEIHNLPVIEVPTNKPIARIDHKDKVFKTKKEKYLAIANDIKECYSQGRPVLIGTPSVYVSQIIDTILTRMKIPHNVLNAKNHTLEAEIISHAGEVGAVTVATNMAGRGTDIQLSKEAKMLGGLKVLGVERNDSRRIDNQLRGRSGRQGDVGESIFYLSLEDDLMKLFSTGNSLNNLFSMSMPYGEPIQSKILSKAIRNAQKQIEGIHYNQRKNVIEYDQVISKQRSIIYSDRDSLLKNDTLNNVDTLIDNYIESIVNRYDYNMTLSLNDFIHKEIETTLNMDTSTIVIHSADEISNLTKHIKSCFRDSIKNIDSDYITNLIKNTLLDIVDDCWINYLETIDEIQKKANLMCYKQQDPIVEFIYLSQISFNKLIEDIYVKTLSKILGFNYSVFEDTDYFSN